MAINVSCICGEDFALKDEWAGRRVTCPICKSPIDVPERPVVSGVAAASASRGYREIPAPALDVAPTPVAGRTHLPPPAPVGTAQRSAYGNPPLANYVPRERMAVPEVRGDLIGMYHHPLFRRDLFLVNQRMFQINSKYHIYDEQQFVIGFVERPSHVGPMLLALLAWFAIAIIGMLTTAFLVDVVDPNSTGFGGVFAFIFGAAVVVVATFVAMALNPLRHSTIYQDESKTYPLLIIRQDTKFQVFHTNFTVTMPDGEILGYLRKPLVYNLLRKRWNWLDADRMLVCIAREDSLILSLIRRIFGDLAMLIRTNFHFFHPETEIVIGEFNRKLTIQDRYVLDLRQDPEHYLDRRVALALGIMLDTGERR